MTGENLTQQFGEDQLADDNGQQAGYRGWPKDMSEGEIKKINSGYDPNMWCTHYLDGSWCRQAYGKNPSYSFRTSHGYHEWIVGNGNRFEYHPSSYHSVHKGDANHSYNGSVDEKHENVYRQNSGDEQGGGHYIDAGKGGAVYGSGGDEKGGKVHYSDGSINVASAQHMKHTASKTITYGRGDDGGEMKQYVHMDENGAITIASKGGQINIQAPKGGKIKIAAEGGLAIESQGDLTLSSKGGQVSISAGSTINLGAGKDILASHPLPSDAPIKTAYGKERGVHSGEYNSAQKSSGSETT